MNPVAFVDAALSRLSPEAQAWATGLCERTTLESAATLYLRLGFPDTQERLEKLVGILMGAKK